MSRPKSSTAHDPGNSKLMLFIRDAVLPYDGDDCLIWPFGRDPNGYAGTVRNGKRICIHRYVCELTKGAPPTPKHEAAHSCHNGSGGCVNPRHLSWKTHAENIGSAPPKLRRAKLFPHQTDEIRALQGKEPIQVTAARFGVTATTVWDIQNGRRRKERSYRIFSDDEVRAIRISSSTLKTEAAKYGVKLGVISRIRLRMSYGYVPDSPLTATEPESK